MNQEKAAERAIWFGAARSYTSASSTEQQELLLMAEAKVAGLDTQVEAKVARAQRQQVAAEAKVVVRSAALDARLMVLQVATDQLVEGEQDLAAKR